MLDTVLGILSGACPTQDLTQEYALGNLGICSIVCSVQESEGCQTELHLMAKHIDRGYEWNEWEHRRKALAMVNLRQKRTHGSQTILSHFRRENATQVSIDKAANAAQSSTASS